MRKTYGFLHTLQSREQFGICSQTLDQFDQWRGVGGTVHEWDPGYLKIQIFGLQDYHLTVKTSPVRKSTFISEFEYNILSMSVKIIKKWNLAVKQAQRAVK